MLRWCVVVVVAAALGAGVVAVFLASLSLRLACWYLVLLLEVTQDLLEPGLERLGLRLLPEFFAAVQDWLWSDWLSSAILGAGFLRLRWLREPEALERLEALAAGLRLGPQPPLDPATDDSVCAALLAFRRAVPVCEVLDKWLTDSSRMPHQLRELAEARRLTHWDESCWGLSGVLLDLRAALLPDIRGALLQRPSPASPRLRALVLRLSADHSHWRHGQHSQKARSINSTAVRMVCDEDEDADMVDGAWEVLLKRSSYAEWTWYALWVLRENLQRPMPRLAKLFAGNEEAGNSATEWILGTLGEPRPPLAGLATQARLGFRWAGLELSDVVRRFPQMSQERRTAFRAQSDFGSLAPALLGALRRRVPAADERFVARCLYNLLLFVRSASVSPEERAVAVGEWVRAGLVPLLRALEAEGKPSLGGPARDLLGILAGPPHRLVSSLPSSLIASHAQAEDDAYFARCPRIPHKLSVHL